MNTGWVFVALSILSYGTWGFFAKLAQEKGVEPTMASVLTAIGSLIIAVVWFFAFTSTPQLKLSRAGLTTGLLSGVWVGLGNIFIYKSLTSVPASLAYPASTLYVVVTAILAILFLKEHITINHGLGILFSLLAVFFLSRN